MSLDVSHFIDSFYSIIIGYFYKGCQVYQTKSITVSKNYIDPVFIPIVLFFDNLTHVYNILIILTPPFLMSLSPL